MIASTSACEKSKSEGWKSAEDEVNAEKSVMPVLEVLAPLLLPDSKPEGGKRKESWRQSQESPVTALCGMLHSRDRTLDI